MPSVSLYKTAAQLLLDSIDNNVEVVQRCESLGCTEPMDDILSYIRTHLQSEENLMWIRDGFTIGPDLGMDYAIVDTSNEGGTRDYDSNDNTYLGGL